MIAKVVERLRRMTICYVGGADRSPEDRINYNDQHSGPGGNG